MHFFANAFIHPFHFVNVKRRDEVIPGKKNEDNDLPH